MSTYRFKQVDVFTSRPLFGNPVAVVIGADGLSGAEMQRFAAWTNLSETTFILKPTTPEADYRLRIFHPTDELPFAGHPTVGSAHAALEAGVIAADKRSFKQECGGGILPLRVEGDGSERLIFVEAPRAEVLGEHPESVEPVSAALGAAISPSPAPMAVRNGPVWLFCHVDSPDTIAALRPDMGALARVSGDLHTGVAVFALPRGADHAVRIRCFAPAVGVPEDPVTGSANAALPTYLARTGLLDAVGRDYIAGQGTELGRDGRVHVRVLDDTGRAEIGGQAVTVIDGEVRL